MITFHAKLLRNFSRYSRHPDPAVEAILVAFSLVFGRASAQSLFLGTCVAFAGIAMIYWVRMYEFLGRSVTEPQFFSGPYLFVRHPTVLGKLLFFSAFPFTGRLPWMFFAGLVLLGFCYRRSMLLRDNALVQALGSNGREYLNHVPALVPMLWPAKLLFKQGGVTADVFAVEPAVSLSRALIIGHPPLWNHIGGWILFAGWMWLISLSTSGAMIRLWF